MIMVKPYHFQEELQAWQLELRDDSFQNFSTIPSQKQTVALVIAMNQVLAKLGYRSRQFNKLRYYIMSVLIGRSITTTYQLRVGQIHTMLRNIYDDQNQVNERAVELFADLARKA